jgi:hypothetical protein
MVLDDSSACAFNSLPDPKVVGYGVGHGDADVSECILPFTFQPCG